MGHRLRFIEAIAVLAVLGAAGCAGVDRFGTKLDMVTGRLGEAGTFVYEGRLEAIEHIGAMEAIQFADGKFYDVVDAPPALMPGDDVRIYKTDDGYVAHLWRAEHATQASAK